MRYQPLDGSPPAQKGLDTGSKLAIGVVTALFVLGCCCSLFLSYLLYNANQSPQNVTISVDAPAQVTSGDQVIIEVQVDNTASESQVLYSIDMAYTYLDSIHIEQTTPAAEDILEIPIVDYRSFILKHTIPSGQGATIQLSGQAMRIGTYTGMVHVCINDGGICESHEITTIVR